MSKLSTVQNKTIEEFWYNIDDYRKRLKFREWELLNPYNEHEMVGGRSGKISDTTGNRAILLSEDANYQHLQSIIKAIEKVYKQCDDNMKKLIHMRYWFDEIEDEWDDVAANLYVSRRTALRMRNLLIDKTAEEIGWI